MEVLGLARLPDVQQWVASGWIIHEPVIQRSAYHTPAGRVCTLELVLACATKRRLVALADQPEVRAFLQQQQLTMVDGA